MTKILVVFLAFVTLWAEANLVIHPIRVQFNPGDRSTEVTLLNDSQKQNTYRLEWVEQQGNVGGGYTALKGDELKKFPIASGMVRFTPRQVTLKPGERQTIKLSLRRPANLANGEYRSHLRFKALPPPGSLARPDEQTAGMALRLNLVTSFSIPVVVQQGKLDAQVALENASINYNASNLSGSSVSLVVKRVGGFSVYGDFEAYWTPVGGNESLIAKAGSISLWPEADKRKLSLAWVGTDFAKSSGKLRVLYKGKRDFEGQTFFDTSIQVEGSDIK